MIVSKQFNVLAKSGTKQGRLKGIGLITAFATLFVALAASASAQGVITPAELRVACENSPQNTVSYPNGTKIAPDALTSESVTTGCTIILGSDAAFELVRTRLNFSGPLRILGSEKSRVVLVERSLLEAQSASFDLVGLASELKVDNSIVRATAGDLDIRMGTGAKLQIKATPPFYPSELYSLEAKGSMRIVGGDRLTAELEETFILGEVGFSLDLGAESVLKANRVEISGGEPAGVAIRSTSPKVLLELTSTDVLAEGRPGTGREHFADLTVELNGPESSIKASSTRFGSQGRTLLSVSESTSGGLIELAGNATLDVGPDSGVWGRNVVVQASAASTKGVIKVSRSVGTAMPNAADSEVIFRTGSLGTTEIVGSGLYASVAIRILTGPQGTCKQELNQIGGNGTGEPPVLQLCTQ